MRQARRTPPLQGLITAPSMASAAAERSSPSSIFESDRITRRAGHRRRDAGRTASGHRSTRSTRRRFGSRFHAERNWISSQPIPSMIRIRLHRLSAECRRGVARSSRRGDHRGHERQRDFFGSRADGPARIRIRALDIFADTLRPITRRALVQRHHPYLLPDVEAGAAGLRALGQIDAARHQEMCATRRLSRLRRQPTEEGRGFVFVRNAAASFFNVCICNVGQTHAFDHITETGDHRRFPGVKNPADPRECSRKRPRRTEDPKDGTHCLVSKTMAIRLVGKGDSAKRRAATASAKHIRGFTALSRRTPARFSRASTRAGGPARLQGPSK